MREFFYAILPSKGLAESSKQLTQCFRVHGHFPPRLLRRGPRESRSHWLLFPLVCDCVPDPFQTGPASECLLRVLFIHQENGFIVCSVDHVCKHSLKSHANDFLRVSPMPCPRSPRLSSQCYKLALGSQLVLLKPRPEHCSGRGGR